MTLEPKRCADCKRRFRPYSEKQDYCFPCWREIRETQIELNDPWRQYNTPAESEEATESFFEAVERGRREIEALRRMPYAEYLQTEYWQNLRKEVIRMAEYQCQRCGARGPAESTLHVHHRTYKRRGWELIEYLEVLCSDCHEVEHGV